MLFVILWIIFFRNFSLELCLESLILLTKQKVFSEIFFFFVDMTETLSCNKKVLCFAGDFLQDICFCFKSHEHKKVQNFNEQKHLIAFNKGTKNTKNIPFLKIPIKCWKAWHWKAHENSYLRKFAPKRQIFNSFLKAM